MFEFFPIRAVPCEAFLSSEALAKEEAKQGRFVCCQACRFARNVVKTPFSSPSVTKTWIRFSVDQPAKLPVFPVAFPPCPLCPRSGLAL